jgi:hypothetical protein
LTGGLCWEEMLTTCSESANSSSSCGSRWWSEDNMIKRERENNSVLLYFWNFSETSAQTEKCSSFTFFTCSINMLISIMLYISALDRVKSMTLSANVICCDEKLLSCFLGVSSMSPALLTFVINVVLCYHTTELPTREGVFTETS